MSRRWLGRSHPVAVPSPAQADLGYSRFILRRGLSCPETDHKTDGSRDSLSSCSRNSKGSSLQTSGRFFDCHLCPVRWCKWAACVLEAKFAVDQQLRQGERRQLAEIPFLLRSLQAVVGAGCAGAAFASADLPSQTNWSSAKARWNVIGGPGCT